MRQYSNNLATARLQIAVDNCTFRGTIRGWLKKHAPRAIVILAALAGFVDLTNMYLRDQLHLMAAQRADLALFCFYISVGLATAATISLMIAKGSR